MLTSCGKPLMVLPSLLHISAVYSDSDSEWSSLERRAAAGGHESGDLAARPPRKSSSHKRPRRKRAAIPVATPRVPPLPSTLHHNPPTGVPLPLSTRPRASDLAATVDKGIVVMQQHSTYSALFHSCPLPLSLPLFPLHGGLQSYCPLSIYHYNSYLIIFFIISIFFCENSHACRAPFFPIPRLVLHQDLAVNAFLCLIFSLHCYSPFDAFLAMVCHLFVTVSVSFITGGILQLNAHNI